MAPGSIAKIATLIAAFDEGIVGPGSRLPCRGRVVVGGHEMTCVHPPFAGPLSAAEALAWSCNDYFSTVGARVSKQALDAALVRLGLTPLAPGASVALGSVGLGGAHATPRAMLRGFCRLAMDATASSSRRVPADVIDGLRGAATYGTAASLAARGVDALAKTGTAPMPGGGQMGLALAVTTPAAPSRGVVVVAPGGSGRDAAEIAARLLETGAAPEADGGGDPAADTPPAPPPPGTDARQPVLWVGRLTAGGTYRIEHIPLEDYVAGVVAAEAPPGARPAAREALAVAARTYALANGGRHRAEGFDLCDLTHCQVLGRAAEEDIRAARETAGLVLFAGSRTAPVLYTASCGGQLERPSSIWGAGAEDDGFTTRVEPACREAAAWTAEIGAADLERAFRAAGLRGALRDLAVDERSPTGLAIRIRADGFAPQHVGGEAFRLLVGRTLGWGLVRSARFTVVRTARGFRFTGTGRGHLAGLCVTGAAREAAAGAGRDEILATYFPGLRLAPFTPDLDVPQIGITLPAADQKSTNEVRALVAVELRRLERVTGRRAPQAVSVIFHPTVASYERATGLPWWTAAAGTGSRVDCLPIDVLRRRGILAATIRHELAHLLTEPVLAGRPRWVREGASMHLAGEGVGPGASSGGEIAHGEADCPADDRFTRAASRAEAEAAYRAARACFAAALRRVGRWEDVGR